MEAHSKRWQEISPSEFPWEQEALAFVREGLPDIDPVRAWSNFEFIGDDGSVNEVDLLVLTDAGFWLIEIKSKPGTVQGDAGTWTWRDGPSVYSIDNPLLLANRKAKKLAGLLKRQKALQRHRAPFLQAVVFLSAKGIDCQLEQAGRHHVYLRDNPKRPGQGILGALLGTSPGASASGSRGRIDRALAGAIGRAMNDAGIRASHKRRQVGDYRLEELIYEGPNYQDWAASHVALERTRRRVRLYPVAMAARNGDREAVLRAARREFQVLEGIEHPGILRAHEYKEHELGPALLFEHDPDAVRLDHFVRDRGERLDVGMRLDLLRQVAEAIKHAHAQRLYHRGLSPQCVLVHEAASGRPRLRVFNWQTGSRGHATTGGLPSLPGTVHLERLVEEASAVYLAPESQSAEAPDPAQLDVFSLGALAYFLFSGRPPGVGLAERDRELREGRGLRLSAVIDGVNEELEALVRESTAPEVTNRLDSAADLLDYLELVEEALTRPEEEHAGDPTEAKVGARLPGGFRVEKRLGKGSSAVAYLVNRGGEEGVLKVALEPELNDRLAGEGEVLKKLHHQSIVQYRETVTVGDRTALLTSFAGEETLAKRIRADGRLHVDLLQRFGEDLLEAVKHLEEMGIPHRDIKPDNIGVRPVGRDNQLHLVLFDFSLSRTPADRIRAGTPPYLEPFLGQRPVPRWDVAAERYAVAVTLHEMATGVLPVFGDGKSAPEVTCDEARIDGDLFDPTPRDALVGFFTRALRRDPKDRFDNAAEMLREWRKVFDRLDKPPARREPDSEDAAAPSFDGATLATPLAALRFSTRALNALERVGAVTVRDLLRLQVGRLSRLRGVGHKTRRELLEAIRVLLPMFPPEEIAAAPEPEVETKVQAPGDLLPTTLEDVVAALVPVPRGVHGGREHEMLRLYLGLDSSPDGPRPAWPSQTDVAAACGVKRARMGQVASKARGRWQKVSVVTLLRDSVEEILGALGGVATAEEVERALLTKWAADSGEPARTRLARAAARVACEVEGALREPRWITRRFASRVLLAGEPGGQALAAWAIRLGEKADLLARQDPLPSPSSVQEELLRVAPPSGAVPVSSVRLVHLAAAVSQIACVSGLLELYPRDMPAPRALRLARRALPVTERVPVDVVRDRVASRYPDAAPLPDRPDLDRLLREVGWEYDWQEPTTGDGSGAYVTRTRDLRTLSPTDSTTHQRHATYGPPIDVAPESLGEARQLEIRLRRAASEGAFLVLLCRPRDLLKVEQELEKRFQVQVVSLEEELLGAMREVATENAVAWEVVLQADAEEPGSRGWTNLLRLVGRALEKVERSLMDRDATLVLTRLGALARYGKVGFLDRLRDAMGKRECRLRGVWALVAAYSDAERPLLDGAPVPVITRAQWGTIPASWVDNEHRAGLAAAAERDS